MNEDRRRSVRHGGASETVPPSFTGGERLMDGLGAVASGAFRQGVAMITETRHISVCVCTYKRPRFLSRLLRELGSQSTGGLFKYSIVVADNDHLESARGIVSDFAATSDHAVRYCVEPRQNIALARNKALENATGEFVAFIDDDELPTPQWLRTLFEACGEYGVDGVLGPVMPRFDEEPPWWVVRGGFYERPTYPTGFVIDWRKGRTGNVLLKRQIFASSDQPFRPEFLTGEDQDFFRRMIAKGHKFIWCNEAVAYESVPPIRWKPKFMVRRALFRGAASMLHPTFRAGELAKAMVAIPTYLAALPFALMLGYHRFMICLVKLCSHIGKMLACAGVSLIGEPYITD